MSHLRIQIRTPMNGHHTRVTFVLGAVVFFSALLGVLLDNGFGVVEKSILQSRNISVAEGSDIFFATFLIPIDSVRLRQTNPVSQ